MEARVIVASRGEGSLVIGPAMIQNLRTRLGHSYRAWQLYHLLVADAVAIQRPTKYAIVREFLGDCRGRVADIGCGPGVFTRFLAARAEHVCSVDIDCASLERMKARHRRLANVAFVAADAERLPFEDGVLSVALVLETLEHVQDDATAVCELARVLEPGGRLVLSVPVPPGEVNEGDPLGHKREGYQRKEIECLLERHGFVVQQQRFAEFRFSRFAAKLVRLWRKWLRVPAPIVLSWVGYLDHFLDSQERRQGGYLPATVVILASRSR